MKATSLLCKVCNCTVHEVEYGWGWVCNCDGTKDISEYKKQRDNGNNQG